MYTIQWRGWNGKNESNRSSSSSTKKEGVHIAFGVPGAAINPMYAAMKALGGIEHVLARHVEGASHMAEGLHAQSKIALGYV
ncbi:glyoxylate carboligase [Vibrio variabilis]|uniref:Glyoxylate carboligase n=1 Tax=Vibrio variabilis TaxID=990271 RepID=A0ABQ0JNG1_9VIBR|nr:glyoxylate carboligase [Vibrio variabilis]